MRFSLPGLLFAIASFLLALAFYRQKRASIPLSHHVLKASNKAQMKRDFPRILQLLALFFFALSLADPHTEQKIADPSYKIANGVALYLVLDHSGSMQQRVPNGQMRLEVMKEVAKEFVQKRTNDLLGALAFSRNAEILSPLTFDHQTLIDKINRIDLVKSQEEEGTAIGYALYKASAMMAQESEAGRDFKSKGVILITDGIQDPSILDRGKRLKNLSILESAEFAAKYGVKFYLINVEPKIAESQWRLPREELEKAAAMTGGKFFIVDNPYGLRGVLENIDRLEKSPLKETKPLFKRLDSYYPILITLGLIALALSILFESYFFRRVP